MDTKTFANTIRQKYPDGVAKDGVAYRDMPDEELTHRVVTKYPVYRDQVTDYKAPDTSFIGALTGQNMPTAKENQQIEMQGGTSETNYLAQAIKNPGETFKGAVKGIPGGAASVTEGLDVLSTKLSETIPEGLQPSGLQTLTEARKALGKEPGETTLDYTDVEELTAPSNKAQEVGYGGVQLLPVERAFTAGKPLVEAGIDAMKPIVSAIKEPLARRALGKSEQIAFDAITPSTKDLTVAEYENLLKQGKITPKTTTKPSEYVLTPKEIDIAKQNAPLLQSKDPVQNSINVINEIDKTDKSVGTFLKENNNIFNDAELRTYLADKMKDITDVMVDEKRLDKTKLQMIDNFIKGLPKNNMESLWKNRKEFDQYIEKAFSGSPNLQKELKKGLRNSVQDFIADRTPEGEYKAAMRKMTELFDLHDIVATKAAKEKGLNAIQAWMKANPVKTKLIGGASVLVPTGATIYQMSK